MPLKTCHLRPLAQPGVLDFAPGAAAAYSLRSLSNSYAGPVVTVRRSTDNAEADFTAAEVSDGTLSGWAGADGFVKQWWDQSGNARHATASGTAQPQIVDSGVLVTEGGNAAVRFDGSDDTLINSTLTGVGTGLISTFFVSRATGITGYRTPLKVGDPNTTTAFAALLYSTDGANNDGPFIVGRIGGNFLDTTAPTGTDALVISGLRTTASNFSLFANGAPTIPASGDPSGMNIGNGLRIGAYTSASQFWLGTISELIIYPTDQTALRTRIEGNLAWYY